MKKWKLIIAGVLCASSLMACGAKPDAQTDKKTEKQAETQVEADVDIDAKEDEQVNYPNPWVESDRQGVVEATSYELDPLEGATDVVYSYLTDLCLAQVTFKKDGCDWVYRVQPTDSLEDISGMNYKWDSVDDAAVLKYKGEFKAYSDATEDTEYIDDVNVVQVLNWYDTDLKATRSLSVSGTGVNGLDLEVIAGDLY